MMLLGKPTLELVTPIFGLDKSDLQKHVDSCVQCQVRKKYYSKYVQWHPLPLLDQPKQQIHVDLFGPLKTSKHSNKFILCITDAFTRGHGGRVV